MRKLVAKILKLVAVNAVLLIVLTELASVAVYFDKTRDLFYMRNRS